MIDKNTIPKYWKVLSFFELLDYNQPINYIVESTDYSENYKTPVLTAGKTFIIGYTNEKVGIFNDLPVIIFDDFTTATQFVTFPFKVKSSAMKILKPKDENVNIKFIFYFMQTIHLKSETHKRYWISEYSKLPIPIPSLSVQNKIVSKIEELFSELDKGKQQLETVRQKLKTYRKSLLNTIIEDKNNHLISSIIEKLDQGWSPRCLNEQSADDGEWAVIKTTAVQSGRFVPAENKILPKELNPRVQHELKTGDVLITRAGPRIRVGVCCMVRKIRPKLINCDKVYRIRVNNGKAMPEYLEMVLNTPYYQHEIEKMKTGISDSGVNLTQTQFLKISLPIPDLDEQKQIVTEIESRLSVCDKMEEIIETSLKQAESLRQSILKQAFEGKLI